jgi:endonuclease/exonuclease/phosphatase family metal-dependent hydrolase
VFTNVVLAGAAVQPGQEIFFRWFDTDDSGSDDGLAIDNLTVAFSPTAPDTNTPPVVATGALTLLTYNVAGNGTTDWSTNSPQVQAIGRQMQYLQPDIITFVEIPYTNTWQMANFVAAFLPGYSLATNSGTDGSIRSAILSRFPITRSQSWLARSDLKPFGYTNANSNADNFTRDLFEAQISVPGFDQPLHVFTTHLKSTSGTTYADAAAKRAAEAAAFTNFLATNLFVLYPTDPYVLTGDMNDSDTNAPAIQRLISLPTGLRLTNPTNPVTGSINTFSIRGSLNGRIDFIFPGGLLFSNIASSQVFRTDLLTNPPPPLLTSDGVTASDHLPVMMVLSNPFNTPFRLLSIGMSNQFVTLNWESAAGRRYRVDASSNLSSWVTLATNLAAAGTNFTFSTNVPAPMQFFRVYRVP